MKLSLYNAEKREWHDTDCPLAIRNYIRERKGQTINSVIVFDNGEEISVRVNS